MTVNITQIYRLAVKTTQIYRLAVKTTQIYRLTVKVHTDSKALNVKVYTNLQADC